MMTKTDRLEKENASLKETLRYLMGVISSISQQGELLLRDFGADYKLHNAFCDLLQAASSNVKKLEKKHKVKGMDIFERGDFAENNLAEKKKQKEDTQKEKTEAYKRIWFEELSAFDGTENKRQGDAEYKHEYLGEVKV